MTTETTIKTLVGSEWQGKMKYTVTLADGTAGYLQDKSDDGLKEGDAVTATIEEYTSKAGKKSNLITLIRRTQDVGKQQSSASIPSATLTPTGMSGLKYDARLKCIQLAHDAFLAGKLDDAEAKNHCREWVVLADALIDDLAR